MNIRPTDPRPTPGATPARPDEATAPRPASQDPETRATPAGGGAAGDQVELSDDARQLQETLGLDARTVSQLAPERMRAVLERIASGYYDRDEVRDEVLQRLASDLEGGSREGGPA